MDAAFGTPSNLTGEWPRVAAKMPEKFSDLNVRHNEVVEYEAGDAILRSAVFCI